MAIGDAVAVDPAISSGLPLPSVNRQPPPGSRPEKYSTPATKGSSSQSLHIRQWWGSFSDDTHPPHFSSIRSGAKPLLETRRSPRLSTTLRGHSARAFDAPDPALGPRRRVSSASPFCIAPNSLRAHLIPPICLTGLPRHQTLPPP